MSSCFCTTFVCLKLEIYLHFAVWDLGSYKYKNANTNLLCSYWSIHPLIHWADLGMTVSVITQCGVPGIHTALHSAQWAVTTIHKIFFHCTILHANCTILHNLFLQCSTENNALHSAVHQGETHWCFNLMKATSYSTWHIVPIKYICL